MIPSWWADLCAVAGCLGAFLLTEVSPSSRTGDFWVFGAGLIAGVIIAVALRRDLKPPWDGRNRRKRAQ